MTCLYCEYAASYWVRKRTGEKIKSNKAWFALMNVFCNHPAIGGNGQCLPISWSRCGVYKRAQEDVIARRIDFYKKFDRYKAHASIIAQRGI